MRARFGSAVRTPEIDAQRALVAFAVASVLVIAAAIIAFFFLSAPENTSSTVVARMEPAAPAEQRTVFVPIAPIAANTRLEPVMFRPVNIAAALIPPGALTSLDQISDKFAQTKLLANYPLTPEVLAAQRVSLQDIPAAIPPNSRLITIDVNRRTSFVGFLQPGDHVDLQWLTQTGGRPKLYPLVPNAKVFSTDRRIEHTGQPEDISLVTLLVSARDANKITFAMANGSLSLTLRGKNSDGDPGESSPIDALAIIPGGTQSNSPGSQETTGRIKIDGIYYRVTKSGDLLADERAGVSRFR